MTHQGAQGLGVRGEETAAAELVRQGLEIVDRNWRCRAGEIDIIAVERVDGRCTAVFCEVKCRAGRGFGDPLEAITWNKVRRLRALAGEWLAVQAALPEGLRPDAIRLDAIGVLWPRGAAPEIRHVRGIG
jgi:putative endonuclease